MRLSHTIFDILYMIYDIRYTIFDFYERIFVILYPAPVNRYPGSGIAGLLFLPANPPE